jgi:hypothetical protein
MPVREVTVASKKVQMSSNISNFGQKKKVRVVFHKFSTQFDKITWSSTKKSVGNLIGTSKVYAIHQSIIKRWCKRGTKCCYIANVWRKGILRHSSNFIYLKADSNKTLCYLNKISWVEDEIPNGSDCRAPDAPCLFLRSQSIPRRWWCRPIYRILAKRKKFELFFINFQRGLIKWPNIQLKTRWGT